MAVLAPVTYCSEQGVRVAAASCDPEDPQRYAGATAVLADEALAAEACVLEQLWETEAWQCCAGTDCRADAETVFACAAALGVGEDLQGSNALPSVTAAAVADDGMRRTRSRSRS